MAVGSGVDVGVVVLVERLSSGHDGADRQFSGSSVLDAWAWHPASGIVESHASRSCVDGRKETTLKSARTKGVRVLGLVGATVVAAGAAFAASLASPASAATPPEVFSTWDNSAILNGSTPYVANLQVPAGSYFATSKLSASVGPVGSNVLPFQVFCKLSAGASFDNSTTRIAPPSGVAMVTNQVVQTFAGPGTIRLECNDSTGENLSTLLEHVKITAIRVNSLSNVPLP